MNPNMEYRTLGGTGLIVSVLGYGLMTVKSVEDAKQLLNKCRQGGMNFFDNAEAYGQPRGTSETLFGEALRQLTIEDPQLWRRSDLVITTKLFFGGTRDTTNDTTLDYSTFAKNEIGLSRKHLAEGMEASLKRLQLNYVDVVYAHRPDPLTPMEEVVRGFTQLIREGKAFYWGTSEWSAQQLTEAYWVAKTNGLIPPIVDQPQYNICFRDRVEAELAPLYKAPYNLGTTVWGVLSAGFLTGKYRLGDIPRESRMTDPAFKRFRAVYNMRADALADKIDTFVDYAREKGITPAVLAYAWAVKNPNVSVVILGASKPQQIEESLGCIQVARDLLTETEMKKIDERMGTKPPAPMDFGRVVSKL